MRNPLKTVGIIAATWAMASCTSGEIAADYQVIPLPQEVTIVQGKPFSLDADVAIVYPKNNEKMHKNALFLADYLKKATGTEFSLKTGEASKGAIVLQLGLQADPPEAYQLKVDQDGVLITATTEAGVFYAIQTLRKSIPAKAEGTVVLPPVEINDFPRFGYRGAHFDVSRHFFTVEEVKTYIDMMVLHNMNRLHWHITDDQGWRIEIKKYPKLTQEGANRKETVIGRNSGEYDGQPYGGYYTQEQAKEIVAYAAERYVTVIPEVDLPGHMQAALTAYPRLGCTGGPYEVWTQWGVSENVLCAGNDDVLTFIDDVFTEIMEIFPSEYIHVGGDECPKIRWEACPKCQARIKTLGLKDDAKHSKEEYLQSFIINHAEVFLNKHGRQIIGWDEILEGGLAPNSTVMSWRGEAGGIEAAKLNHDVIMTPNSYLYLDYYQTKETDNEPLAIGGYLPIDRVYNYEPMPAELTAEQQKHIIGVQANLWTEYIPTLAQAQYMVLPRWAALSEVQWSNPAQKNYDDFLQRLTRLMGIYDAQKYNNAKHVFKVSAHFTADEATGNIYVELETIDQAPIYYTLDGTEPTKDSHQYLEKMVIKESATLKAKSIRATGESASTTEQLVLAKSTAKPIKANKPINEKYTYAGVTTLVDGLIGNSNFRTGRWIAYLENDMDVTIDLLQPIEIATVSIRACVEKGDWVFDARALSVEVSQDGVDFTKVASEEYPAMKQEDRDGIVEHLLKFTPISARYVRVVATTEKKIPSWHGGKGAPAFLFVDEVIIN